ncbi:hypothetical protein [Methylobacterium radiotolerans]|uniref:hypothetical protein n=1 Tax=Methylobacterium radiotolerans TaxID=31998 RepID=UPI0011158C48|nr:hypothetical protein [Methylobacterium radiotolerans]
MSAAALSLPAGAAQDGADPAPPAVAKVGTDIRGWLATIAGLLKLGPATKAASASMTMTTDLANIEPVGAAINGTAMPAGGVGLTGWLSALWSAITSANQRSAFLMEANGTAVGAGVTYTGAAGDAGGTPSVYACFSATVLST